MVMTGIEIPLIMAVVNLVARVVPIPMVGPHSTEVKTQEGRERLSVAVAVFEDAKMDMDEEDRQRLITAYGRLKAQRAKLDNVSGVRTCYPTNCWKAHKFAFGVEKFLEDTNLTSCDAKRAKDRKMRGISTQEVAAFAKLDAAKKNPIVQSAAAESGCTAEDCSYYLMEKERIYFDGIRSSTILSNPSVLVQDDIVYVQSQTAKKSK